MSARKGASASPLGAGMPYTTASRRSCTPSPVLPLASTASSAGSASPSSISALTRSGSAAGRSILLMSGTISKSAFIASIAFATVWASTPCVASTTRTAPSHAAKLRPTS